MRRRLTGWKKTRRYDPQHGGLIMAQRHWPWDVLGIDRTGDKAAIRSAYAVQLKAMDVDRDIQGFAELRAARDQALREAAYADEVRDVDPLADAGAFDQNPSDQPHEPPADEPGDDDDDAVWDEQWDDLFPIADDYATARHYPGPAWSTGEVDSDYEASTADNVDLAADRDLARLLFPAGEQSDEGFTHPEFEAAQAALDTLLTDARSGDLSQEQAIDSWLAEMLAQGWPRSAPLVEQSAEAFGWLDQSGAISERPALQFLNPRLRGMRFVAKVEQPGHRLHKAWMELKRPGKHTLADKLRIRRDDIEMLLSGIRSRYPEVESHLDGERVASWEKPAPSWIAWTVQRVFIFIVVIQLVGLCSRTFDGNDLPPQAVNQIVAESSGPGVTMAQVQAADPKLADLIYAEIDAATGADDDLAAIKQAVAVRMRELAAIAMGDAPKGDVLAILAVRRDLLVAASGTGGAACTAFLKTARLPDGVIVPEATRAEERALLWHLARARLLDPEYTASRDQTMPLPPWAGSAVAQRTGLPAERINAVLKGEETGDTCAVRIALIDTLLSRPDEAPIELLRFM